MKYYREISLYLDIENLEIEEALRFYNKNIALVRTDIDGLLMSKTLDPCSQLAKISIVMKMQKRITLKYTVNPRLEVDL